MKYLAAIALCLLAGPSLAQQNQCRTAPPGTSTAYCASEAFVTQSVASRPYFEAYLSADQTPVSDSTATLVNLNTIIKDSNSWFNTTSHLYTPQLAGSYRVTVHIRCAATTLTVCQPEIRLNGAAYARTGQLTSSMPRADLEVTAIVPLNGSTDTLAAWGFIIGSGTESFTGGTGPILSYMLAEWVGP